MEAQLRLQQPEKPATAFAGTALEQSLPQLFDWHAGGLPWPATQRLLQLEACLELEPPVVASHPFLLAEELQAVPLFEALLDMRRQVAQTMFEASQRQERHPWLHVLRPGGHPVIRAEFRRQVQVNVAALGGALRCSADARQEAQGRLRGATIHGGAAGIVQPMEERRVAAAWVLKSGQCFHVAAMGLELLQGLVEHAAGGPVVPGAVALLSPSVLQGPGAEGGDLLLVRRLVELARGRGQDVQKLLEMQPEERDASLRRSLDALARNQLGVELVQAAQVVFVSADHPLVVVFGRARWTCSLQHAWPEASCQQRLA